MSMRTVFVVAMWALAHVAMAGGAGTGPENSLYNPLDYTPIRASLNYSSGTLTFNTDSGQVSHSVDGLIGTGKIGVTNQNGNVHMAVFTFGSVHLGAGVTVVVTGAQGLVLASQVRMDIGTTISVSGAPGGSVGGEGGPGGEGGARKSSFSSAPPPSYGGDGGNNGAVGRGYGGGYYAGGHSGATGGGYGGAGGRSSSSTDVGVSYGNDLLHNLYGGSGGAGGGNFDMGGGGGGGAIELVANKSLTLSGTINACGGAGKSGTSVYPTGGGSGGGVILASDIINIATGSEAINACGGAGAASTTYTTRGSGGGGGGRVAFYANSLSGLIAGTTVNVSGGLKHPSHTGDATDGAPGSFRYYGDGGEGKLSFPFLLPRGTVVTFR